MKQYPLTDFYHTPDSFLQGGKPGDLIRLEKFDGYKVPPGVKGYRVLYGTKTSKGELAVSSGAILIPAGEAPDGGWPVLAWGHGTSGIARKCAPSLTEMAFAMYRGPMAYLENGYAIVATDYAGLGSESPVAYMDRIGNAQDIIYSVEAAQKADLQLGNRWIAVGHSAGAHAAGGVAMLQSDIKDPDYLGFASLSGLQNARPPMVGITKRDPSLAVLLCVSVKNRFPEFDFNTVFTEKGIEFVEQIKVRCQGPGFGRPEPHGLQPVAILKEDWDQVPYVDDYFKLDETETKHHRGPALIVIGENEETWTLKNDREKAKLICEQGQAVQLSMIPGGNHFNLLDKSIDVQLDWFSKRFSGVSPSNCGEMD